MDSATVVSLPGDGFVLRPIEESDAPLLVAASKTDIPEWTFVARNLDLVAAVEPIKRSEKFRQAGRAIRFVIEVEGQSAGTVGAHHPHERDLGYAETFYFVLPEFRRRGLAHRSVLVVEGWLRETIPDLRRLQLWVISGNPGSGRVAELAGYELEGTARKQMPPVNGYGPRDALLYGKVIKRSAL